MRHLSIAAAALLVLAPAMVSAQSEWQKATATSVNAGVHSNSTFKVQAMVTLPNQCYMARIVSSPISMHTHRYFTVLQMAPSSPCAQKSQYTCAVISPAFPMPIPQTFEVDSKGKNWKVQL